MTDFPWPTDLASIANWIKNDYEIVYPALIAVLGVALLEGIRRIPSSEKAHDWTLIVVSSVVIGWIDSTSFIVLLLLSCVVYVVIRSGRFGREYLLGLTAFVVGALVGIKAVALYGFSEPMFLIGFSYYVFRLGSVLIEHGRRTAGYEQVPVHRFFAYVLFFPLFLAGPVQRLHDFRRVEVSSRKVSNLYTALVFLLLAKLTLVDFVLYGVFLEPMRTELMPSIAQWPPMPRVEFVFVHGLASFLAGYLDLAIYTGVAIKLGALLGYHVVPNFNQPLLAANITDFWRRWHISLSGWARDYVYLPVMIQTRSIWIASYATMLTIGLWHTPNWAWALWALAHGSAIGAYNHMRRSRVYPVMTRTRTRRFALRISGNVATISFVSLVYNLVAFPHDYALAWKLMNSAVGLE